MILSLAAAINALPASAAEVQQLAPGVHLIPGEFVPGSQPDGNTVIFDAPSGLVVVDTGRHQQHTQAIADFANDSGKLVAAVVNSHWHLDHIGGNIMLRREYPNVRVYGSSAVSGALTGFLANYRNQLVQMVEKAKDDTARESFRREIGLIDAGPLLSPDIVVGDSEHLTIAGRRLYLGYEPRAVTAGDVWVYDPKTRVLVAGDLVTMPGPFLDTACPTGWQKSLARISDVDFEWLIPGHGQPMTRADFETWRVAYDNLIECTSSQRRKQECVGGWTKDAAPILRGTDEKFTRALMSYYVDQLRDDPAKFASLCNK